MLNPSENLVGIVIVSLLCGFVGSRLISDLLYSASDLSFDGNTFMDIREVAIFHNNGCEIDIILKSGRSFVCSFENAKLAEKKYNEMVTAWHQSHS
jgi:hypothetical protein